MEYKEQQHNRELHDDQTHYNNEAKMIKNVEDKAKRQNSKRAPYVNDGPENIPLIVAPVVTPDEVNNDIKNVNEIRDSPMEAPNRNRTYKLDNH